MCEAGPHGPAEAGVGDAGPQIPQEPVRRLGEQEGASSPGSTFRVSEQD